HQRVVAARQSAVRGGQAIEAESRGDRIEPRAQPRLAAKVRDGAMGSQEHLLRDLLGLRAVAQHAQRDAEHAMLIRDHELFECARIAGAQAWEQTGRIGAEALAHSVRPPWAREVPGGAQSRAALRTARVAASSVLTGTPAWPRAARTAACRRSPGNGRWTAASPGPRARRDASARAAAP